MLAHIPKFLANERVPLTSQPSSKFVAEQKLAPRQQLRAMDRRSHCDRSHREEDYEPGGEDAFRVKSMPTTSRRRGGNAGLPREGSRSRPSEPPMQSPFDPHRLTANSELNMAIESPAGHQPAMLRQGPPAPDALPRRGSEFASGGTSADQLQRSSATAQSLPRGPTLPLAASTGQRVFPDKKRKEKSPGYFSRIFLGKKRAPKREATFGDDTYGSRSTVLLPAPPRSKKCWASHLPAILAKATETPSQRGSASLGQGREAPSAASGSNSTDALNSLQVPVASQVCPAPLKKAKTRTIHTL